MFQMHINVLEMRPAAEFGTYKPPAIAGDDSLQGRMLIRVSSAARLEDHFRLAVGGTNQIAANFNGPDISDHPALAAFKFRLEIDPANITFKANSFSTKWEDLEHLVAADRILVSTTDEADAGALFRREWEEPKDLQHHQRPHCAGRFKRTPPMGSSWPCLPCQPQLVC